MNPEIDPLNKLTASGDYSYPPPWKLLITNDIISIVPTGIRWHLNTFVFVSIIGFSLFIAYITHDYTIYYLFFFLFGALIASIAFFLLCILDVKHLRNGPWLIWDKKSGRVEIPRQKISLNLKDIVEFRQISGWSDFVGGEYLTELNVITQEQDGKTKYFIAGCAIRNTYVLKKLSKPLSEATGIPLEVVKLKYSQRQKLDLLHPRLL